MVPIAASVFDIKMYLFCSSFLTCTLSLGQALLVLGVDTEVSITASSQFLKIITRGVFSAFLPPTPYNIVTVVPHEVDIAGHSIQMLSGRLVLDSV